VHTAERKNEKSKVEGGDELENAAAAAAAVVE